MNSNTLLIFLDIIVIVSLSFSAIYMFVLTRHMKKIRDGKHDLQRLVGDLSKNITQASDAVQNMKNMADQKGRDIERLIEQANSIIDEMNFINRACDNVAERLGKLVTEGSSIVEQQQEKEIKSLRKQSVAKDLREASDREEKHKNKKDNAEKKEKPANRKPLRATESLLKASETKEDEEKMSRSEQELVNAIKKRFRDTDE